MSDRFVFRLRVYYEDTDAAGIVYYANYLKFIERARTEALLTLGLSQTDLRERFGLVFAVRAARVDYRAPARLEDELTVTTAVVRLGGAGMDLAQQVRRGATLLADCGVSLACLDTQGRPARMPRDLREALAALPAA
jgi:acyl-CoA thioester hydrolase